MPKSIVPFSHKLADAKNDRLTKFYGDALKAIVAYHEEPSSKRDSLRGKMMHACEQLCDAVKRHSMELMQTVPDALCTISDVRHSKDVVDRNVASIIREVKQELEVYFPTTARANNVRQLVPADVAAE